MVNNHNIISLCLTVYTIDYSIDISEPGLDQVLKLLVHTLPEEEVRDQLRTAYVPEWPDLFTASHSKRK